MVLEVGGKRLPPVCILAGGRGTRLGELAREVPKPLVELAGEPFLIHQLRMLADQGAREVVICVGYKGELIESRLGASCCGISILYSYDGPGLDGTLGAIRRARPLLGERFLVLYGDTYLRVDFLAASRAWLASGLLGLMVVLRNAGRWEDSNVQYRAGRVVAHDKRAPSGRMSWIDYGLGGLRSQALDAVPESNSDLADLYGELARRQELCGYPATRRFHEIGTPGAMAETERFLRAHACDVGVVPR